MNTLVSDTPAGAGAGISHDVIQMGRQAKQAARVLLKAPDSAKSAALLAMAELLEQRKDFLQSENAKDLEAASKNGLSAAMLDRLALSDKALGIMVAGLRQIAAMPDPIGSQTASAFRPNGMRVGQMRVPLGVIGIIYESRPNVTIDAAALCLKSGNATILRGGSEAFHSNQALGSIIQAGLTRAGLPAHAVQVVNTTDRAVVGQLITLTDYIDVIIPRGGKGLIARLAAAPGVSLTKAGWEFLQPVGFLNMNLRNKPLDDLRFRQAIAHAIDRQFIIKNIFSTFGEPVNGPFPAGYVFRDTSVETKYPYDPVRAKALLDEMGRTQHREAVDQTAVEHLADDQARLDRLADPHIVGDQQPHHRQLQGHHQRHELISARLHAEMRSASERAGASAKRQTERIR